MSLKMQRLVTAEACFLLSLHASSFSFYGKTKRAATVKDVFVLGKREKRC